MPDPDYLAALLDHPILTENEERTLLNHIRLRTSYSEQALDRLVRCNQRLVYTIAVRYLRSGMGGDQDISDLLQWGNLGLLRAIQKWQPDRGARFATYAAWWIRATVRRGALRYGSPIVRTARQADLVAAVRSATSKLVSRDRPVTAAAIHRLTGLTMFAVQSVMPLLEDTVSLDTHASDSRDALSETIPDNSADPEHLAGQSFDIAWLRQMIGNLPDDQARIIRARYFNDLSQCQVAESEKISRTRVARIERDAMRSLRIMARYQEDSTQRFQS